MFKPPYLHFTEEVGPRDGIWLGTRCLLPRSDLIPDPGLTDLCTYPDVSLYVPLFCFRVARILERFVLCGCPSERSALPAHLLVCPPQHPVGRPPHGNTSKLYYRPSASQPQRAIGGRGGDQPVPRTLAASAPTTTATAQTRPDRQPEERASGAQPGHHPQPHAGLEWDREYRHSQGQGKASPQ